tara:strand:+ start:3396 stop:3785 length:390 start_codon:yes stop_codon:yes gene_type:complete
MNNNLLPYKSNLTRPVKTLRIKQLWGTDGNNITTPFDACMGFVSLQVSIRTTFACVLSIDFTDDHIDNTATSHITPYEFICGTNSYTFRQIPISGQAVRLRIDPTGTPTNTDNIIVLAQYSNVNQIVLV